tara:strand:- start:515 stop:1384 length:870 start_codon:yes stop_codon:yes gene_type:complete
MYFDEELVLDVRFHHLYEYVDYFVIVESEFNHKGEKRDLNFNINNFSKFKDKILYLVKNNQPQEIKEILEADSENDKNNKYIINAAYRENSQRNFIMEGLKEANDEDIILVSDVDEIPKIDNINFNKIKEKIFLFKQDMFYYKFNLSIPNYKWTGTKGCKFKNLKNPQWLRNIKDRKYPFYRLDTFFSENKYISIKIIEDGGWHFSYLKSANEIKHKLKSYLHHREFDLQSLSIKQIEETIKNKMAIYDLKADKTANKVGTGVKLQNFDKQKLPRYIQSNEILFKEWID